MITPVVNYQNSPFKALKFSQNINSNVQFLGHLGTDNYAKNGIDMLIHETAFFRDFQTKKFVTQYIHNIFSNSDNIKIIVGGCSTGEETITLSMMLNSIKDKVSILGIDLSEKVINKAKSRKYFLEISKFQDSLMTDYAAFKDSFLGYNLNKKLSSTQIKQKKLFEEFFEPVLQNNSNISFFKKTLSQLSCKLNSISSIIKDTKEFRLKPNMADNCHFKVGDIRNINEITNNEKSHVIFFSNSLYHITTYSEDGHRFMYLDSEKRLMQLFQKFKANLQPNGLVCFGEEEAYQIPNIQLVTKSMENLGFEPLNETSNHIANVFKKVS